MMQHAGDRLRGGADEDDKASVPASRQQAAAGDAAGVGLGPGIHFQLSRVKFPATVSFLFPLADHQISGNFQGNLRFRFITKASP